MSELRVSKGQGRPDGPEMARANESIVPMLPFDSWFGVSPFGLMRQFSDEIDRMLRGATRGADIDSWSPVIDVHQSGGALIVAAELPGLKREDVKVELTDDALILEGERKREEKEDQEGYHRWERSYGRFYRAIPLPEGARTDQVKAELKDGVLKVSIPIPETKKKLREVPIQEVAKTTM